MEARGNLCERCLKRGIIEPGSKDRPLEVHHKIPLTADNVNDPKVALNWDNMELLCKSCHDEEREKKPKRWTTDAEGHVTIIPPGRSDGARTPQGQGEVKKSAPRSGGTRVHGRATMKEPVRAG